MTYAEYLAAEAAAETRHEYCKGEVWAMAGGTIEHGGLAIAVAREIGLALRDRPCRANGASSIERMAASMSPGQTIWSDPNITRLPQPASTRAWRSR